VGTVWLILAARSVNNLAVSGDRRSSNRATFSYFTPVDRLVGGRLKFAAP
jgi:hypothetical protein